MTDYELYHHGVKGQKWGVRRTAAQLGHRIRKELNKDVSDTVIGKGAKVVGRGIRKELNKDVSDTVIGKGAKVVGRGAAKAGKATKKAVSNKIKQSYKEHQEKQYYKKLHKKKLSQMTDKEINDLTNRVKKEAALKDANYESRMQNARKFYKNVAQKPVDTVVTIYAKEAVKKALGSDSN